MHCEGGPVFVEGRVSRRGSAAQAQAGFDLRLMPTNYVPGFGRNQVIGVDARGRFRGASDPARRRHRCVQLEARRGFLTLPYRISYIVNT